jgi:hypothetical protein
MLKRRYCGAMYWSVPRIVPSPVIALFIVGSCETGGAGRNLPLQLCQTKVQQLRARFGQHNVARLQIAVGNALAMRFVQRVGNFDGILQYLLYRQRTVYNPFRHLHTCKFLLAPTS